MSEIRLNFLNWRPDADDFGNQGLSIADNVIHETEGYKQIALTTSGAFATLNGLGGRTLNSVAGLQVIAIGSDRTVASNSYMMAAVGIPTTTRTQEFALIIEAPSGSMRTGQALTQGATSVALTAFSVCELNNFVFACAKIVGEQTTTAAKTVANNACTMIITT